MRGKKEEEDRRKNESGTGLTCIMNRIGACKNDNDIMVLYL
jgi:hypothetical protein